MCDARVFSWAGERSQSYGGYRRHKLGVAASVAGHIWTGDAHRASADAQAVRHVWQWLQRLEVERGAVAGGIVSAKAN
jgi:hypothetical protein